MVISQEKLFPLMEVIKQKLQNGHVTLGSEMKIHGYKNNGALGILFYSLIFFTQQSNLKNFPLPYRHSLFLNKKKLKLKLFFSFPSP